MCVHIFPSLSRARTFAHPRTHTHTHHPHHAITLSHSCSGCSGEVVALCDGDGGRGRRRRGCGGWGGRRGGARRVCEAGCEVKARGEQRNLRTDTHTPPPLHLHPHTILRLPESRSSHCAVVTILIYCSPAAQQCAHPLHHPILDVCRRQSPCLSLRYVLCVLSSCLSVSLSACSVCACVQSGPLTHTRTALHLALF